MSTKIKGITIKLDADATGLEKALDDITQKLSSTQKQLNSVNRSLKLDPTNTELLEQKQRLLAKAIEQTETKLNALKKAQQSIDTSKAGGQAQYDALTREISGTEQSLKKLNAEQQEFDKTAAQAQASASSFNQGLESIAGKAQSVANATRAMSAAAGAALGGMVALAVKAGQQADEWATLSQQVGLSAETIQEFQYASDQIDVDMNTLVGAVTRMKANLSASADEFDKLGIKTQTAKGSYREIEDIFWDSVRALSQIGNETERDQAAMKIFGRNANELAGLLDDGGKKMKALGQEAQDMGVIVSDEDIQKLNQFNDALDGMKAQLKGALAQLAVPIVEALMPILSQIAAAIKTVAQALASVDPTILRIIGLVIVVIAAISPLASLVANVSLSLVGLSMASTLAAGSLSSLLPYVALIAALALAGAGLGYAIGTLVNAFQDFKAETGSTAGAISKMIQSAASGESAFAQLAGSIVGVFSPVAGQIMTIAGGVANGVNVVKSAFIKMANIFQSFQDKAAKFGSDIMRSFADGIRSAIDTVINAVQRLINMMSNLWSSAERDASQAGSRTARAYVNSYNSTSSMARLTNPQPTNNRSGGGVVNASGSSNSVTYAAVDAINNLANSISNQSNAPTTVNVELVGSAKNIFDTVRVQNNITQTATGYHALA
jgi:uncharacterized protein YjeT (DUF2065 family)